jgi:hypothetical protein
LEKIQFEAVQIDKSQLDKVLVAILPESVRKGRRTSVVKALIPNSKRHSRGSNTNRSQRGTVSSRGSSFTEIEHRPGGRLSKDKVLTLKPVTFAQDGSPSKIVEFESPQQPKLTMLDTASQSSIERPDPKTWNKKLTFQVSKVAVVDSVRGSLMSEGSPSIGLRANKLGLAKLDTFSRNPSSPKQSQNQNQNENQNKNQLYVNTDNPFGTTPLHDSRLSESNLTNAFGKCASNSSIAETPQSDDSPSWGEHRQARGSIMGRLTSSPVHTLDDLMPPKPENQTTEESPKNDAPVAGRRREPYIKKNTQIKSNVKNNLNEACGNNQLQPNNLKDKDIMCMMSFNADDSKSEDKGNSGTSDLTFEVKRKYGKSKSICRILERERMEKFAVRMSFSSNKFSVDNTYGSPSPDFNRLDISTAEFSKPKNENRTSMDDIDAQSEEIPVTALRSVTEECINELIELTPVSELPNVTSPNVMYQKNSQTAVIIEPHFGTPETARMIKNNFILGNDLPPSHSIGRSESPLEKIARVNNSMEGYPTGNGPNSSIVIPTTLGSLKDRNTRNMKKHQNLNMDLVPMEDDVDLQQKLFEYIFNIGPMEIRSHIIQEFLDRPVHLVTVRRIFRMASDAHDIFHTLV